MFRTRNLVSLASPTLLAALVFACGGESDADSDADQNLGGASSGGAGNGSGGTGTGGQNATGGSAATTVPGTENYDCTAPSGTIPALQLVSIADGFERPVLVTHAPGEVDRLFVVQQDGVIKIVTKTGTGAAATYETEATSFLDINERVKSAGEAVNGEYTEEQGLLGLAFHPNYAENGLFYVHYSASVTLADAEAEVEHGDTIIEEFKVSSDSNVADAASVRRVLHIAQPDTNHNGGTITFGSDGYLYIALGDGGGSDDSNGNGQPVDDLLGNILRIDPLESGANAYTSPSGNLKDTVPAAAPEIWDYGLRNPYRVNFDGCTGDLYIGDVGQTKWEEIDIEPAGEGHKNYGWPIMEGLVCGPAGDPCDDTGMTAPVAVFNTAASSVAGGAVYRGTDIPALRGTYFYAETATANRVFTLTYDGTTVTAPVDRTEDVNPSGDSGRATITSIQNGGDGELYFTAFSGDVFKLTAE